MYTLYKKEELINTKNIFINDKNSLYFESQETDRFEMYSMYNMKQSNKNVEKANRKVWK